MHRDVSTFPSNTPPRLPSAAICAQLGASAVGGPAAPGLRDDTIAVIAAAGDRVPVNTYLIEIEAMADAAQ